MMPEATGLSVPAHALVTQIAAQFASLPQVTAFTLAGSQTVSQTDTYSDLDVYVYAAAEIAPETRRKIAGQFADGRIEIDNRFWEPGDEWIDRDTDLKVDIMYRSPQWLEDQLDRVLNRHQASVGYSTCFWHYILHAQIFYDRDGWYARLQEQARRPYPELLRQAIIDKNYPILRRNHSAYHNQIKLAISRRDRVSLNHRAAALLASYFDILFALNLTSNPGEKRLIKQALALPMIPAAMAEQVERLLCGLAAPWEQQETLHNIDALIDALDELLAAQGLLVSSQQ